MKKLQKYSKKLKNGTHKMIEKLETEKKLKLPKKYYGPFCLKFLHEFIDYHKLPKNLELPDQGELSYLALSKIFDVMLHSMGPEKRQEILSELNRYKMDIPVHFRD